MRADRDFALKFVCFAIKSSPTILQQLLFTLNFCFDRDIKKSDGGAYSVQVLYQKQISKEEEFEIKIRASSQNQLDLAMVFLIAVGALLGISLATSSIMAS